MGTPASAHTVLRVPTVLVVDDSPMNLMLLGTILSKEGFRILKAGDGPAGRALTLAESPDLILLDVMMPKETGFETCTKLKTHPATVDIPVIFISALDDVQSKVMGLKIGGVDYITKPFHAEEVLARVRVHLRIRAASRDLVREQQARLEQLRDAQKSLLVRPEDFPQGAFDVYYKPLHEAGGDFYDVFEVGEEIFGYFVADISGHNLGASFLTSALKALLRQYSWTVYPPEDTLRGINSVMRSTLGDGQYLTACYARMNRRRAELSVVSAGHPPLIHVTAGGVAQAVEMESDPLGVLGSVVLQRKDIKVSRGDRIFLYTDGLIEAKDKPGGARRQGIERLCGLCVKTLELPLAGVAKAIAEEIQPPWGRPEDDILLLAVQVPAG